ncbi:MAG: hypothetical protein CEE41_00010 [Hadesarchaea archaeon B3_Hades]|nr:MAG: hypothetical protein CEE41_00010 [Hadesarchaea archaeon B3_Hades]
MQNQYLQRKYYETINELMLPIRNRNGFWEDAYITCWALNELRFELLTNARTKEALMRLCEWII